MEWFRKSAFYLGIFSIGMLFTCNYTQAQNWPIIYGDNIHALIQDLHETYDKGFCLTAFTYDNQGVNKYGWIIKTDLNGNILWDKKFGVGNDRNWFSNSFQTNDNGLVISGITNKYGEGDYDPLFIKTNSCGEIEWCKVFICPDINFGTDVIQTDDGSYIGLLTYYGEGETYARISLVKMDQSGEPVWIQPLAQEDTLIYNEEGHSLYLTSDTNYLISGHAYHPGKHPFWIKIDTVGIQIWDLFWNGLVGQAHQVIEIDTGKFYSTGWGIGAGHPQSPVLMTFDYDGNPVDMHFLLGDTITQGSATGIDYLNDTNLIIGIAWRSTSSPPQDFSEIFITDTLGNILIRRLLLSEYNSPNVIIHTSDNKIIVAGNYVTDSNWDIYLWKLNSDLEDDTLYTQPLAYDSLCPYEIQSDTIDLDCGVFVNIDELPTKEEYESSIKFSPNPAKDWVVLTLPDVLASGDVELVVYDLFGKEARRCGGGEAWGHGSGEAGKQGSREVEPVNRMISLDISGFATGMYVAVVKDRKGKRYTGKFLVSR
jgi:hypothetical protein